MPIDVYAVEHEAGIRALKSDCAAARKTWIICGLPSGREMPGLYLDFIDPWVPFYHDPVMFKQHMSLP